MSYIRSDEQPNGDELFPGVARLLECQLVAVNFAAQKAEQLAKYEDSKEGNQEYVVDRLLMMAGHLKPGVILTYVDDRGYYGEALFEGEMQDPFLMCKCSMETLALEPNISLMDTMHLHAGLVTHINRIPVEILNEVHPDRLRSITREENMDRVQRDVKRHNVQQKLKSLIGEMSKNPVLMAALRTAVERGIKEKYINRDDVPKEILNAKTKEQLIAEGIDIRKMAEEVDIMEIKL